MLATQGKYSSCWLNESTSCTSLLLNHDLIGYTHNTGHVWALIYQIILKIHQRYFKFPTNFVFLDRILLQVDESHSNNLLRLHKTFVRRILMLSNGKKRHLGTNGTEHQIT